MRLTPFQFSISVSVVVLLMAGAAVGGYLYGMKKTAGTKEPVSLNSSSVPPDTDGHSSPSGTTPAPVTFYTVLTEPREEVPETLTPVNPPEERQGEEAEVDQAGGDLSLILQVASYRGREPAANLLESLSTKGYSGTIQAADLGERGIWYRVRIGPYGSEKEAARILEKLRKERDLKGYIVR